MINLLAAEIDRLRSRRVFLIGMAVLFLALAGFQVAVGFSVKQPSTAEIATARTQFQQAQQEYEANKDDYAQEQKECERQAGADGAEACAYPAPSWDDFRPRPETFAGMAGVGVTISIVLPALAFLIIGASSIGAEYGSGAIANWLSFIPDRLKVFASKLVTLLLTAAVVTAAATALTLASTAVLVKINSGAVGKTGDLIAEGGRGLMIVTFAATAGFALALIFRHTIAALGVVLGYLVVDFVLSILMSSIESMQKIKPWLLENNAAAVLQHGYTYYDNRQQVSSDGINYVQIERHLSFGHGLIYLAVIFVVAVLLSALIFRRRDVT
ncbi:MAG TPA: ABC transporter permease subunit [Microlunatus sp.]